METVLFSLLSLIIGGLAVYFILRTKMNKDTATASVLDSARQERIAALESELKTAVSDLEKARENTVTARLALERALSDVKVAEEKAGIFKKAIEEMKLAKKEEMEQLRKEYDDKLQNMTLVFKESAARILKEKSDDLSAVNSKEITELLKPMHSKMEEFRKAVEESKDKTLQTSASMEKQIDLMMQQTKSIGEEANNLAKALKSNNKTLGNWGEVVLLNLLEGMGLRNGDDFVVQQSIKDADGNTVKEEDGSRKVMIPDVVIFLPENKAVVVDSKVSLTAYVDYVNSTDETARAEALKNHLRSVDAHIKELAAKNYSSYVAKSGKYAMDYVVMFIPNEGAFQLFYQNFRDRWHKAFDESRVIIAGESNLFAMLKIIENSWVKVKQEKNIEEVMKVAGELLDRVAKFTNRFYEMGTILEKACSKFEEAGKVLTGRQSLVTTSRKLEKMGVPGGDGFTSVVLKEIENNEKD